MRCLGQDLSTSVPQPGAEFETEPRPEQPSEPRLGPGSCRRSFRPTEHTPYAMSGFQSP